MNKSWELLDPYAYLCVSLSFFGFALLFWTFAPFQRRLMIISGLLSTPFALTSYCFVPDYWQPERIAVFIIGIEDLIFSFSNGVILISIIAWMLPFKLSTTKLYKMSFHRLIQGLLVTGLSYFALIHIGVRVMEATLMMGFLFWAYYMWLCRCRMLAVSLSGGFTFCLFYILVFKWAVHIFPQIPKWFNPTGIVGHAIWGMPLGEILWSIFFGATWPLFLGWVMGWHLTFDVFKNDYGLSNTTHSLKESFQEVAVQKQ